LYHAAHPERALYTDATDYTKGHRFSFFLVPQNKPAAFLGGRSLDFLLRKFAAKHAKDAKKFFKT
jgi:hypothetical protein